MYNSDIPQREELPSTPRLIKSTIAAVLIAATILVTVVMPAEYALDPTGVGKILGLTEMGEIKAQLEQEAEADQIAENQQASPAEESITDKEPSANKELSTSTVPTENTEPSEQTVIEEATAELDNRAEQEALWKDELIFVLTPGQGREYKLIMDKGMVAHFSWASEGGPINYDKHGNGNGQSISYKKGRSVDAEEGQLIAAFSGRHGWFFRNRNKHDVSVTLKLGGQYSELKRVY